MSEKKVDEGWKKQMEHEKTKDVGEEEENRQLAAPSFMHVISIFATQAMLQLGEIEHPVTKQSEIDLNGARYSIDTLELLKEKTKGNLSDEENRALENVLYDLKMRYVMKSGNFKAE